MERAPALSSRAAVVVGTTLALAGLGVVWVALYSPDAALGAPRALVVLAGVMFVLAGARRSSDSRWPAGPQPTDSCRRAHRSRCA